MDFEQADPRVETLLQWQLPTRFAINRTWVRTVRTEWVTTTLQLLRGLEDIYGDAEVPIVSGS